MKTSTISKEEQEKISEMFKTSESSPGENSYKLAEDWLTKHNHAFSRFIDNEFLEVEAHHDIYNRVGTKINIALLEIDSEELKEAFQSPEKNKDSWLNISGFERSHYLYRIAETITKNYELFAQVESMSSDKHLYRAMKDVSNFIQSFNYYAGVAGNVKYSNDEIKPGVVCVISGEYNRPLLSLSWKVASVLAAGNIVVLVVDSISCCSAFLFAELCKLSGLPPGVLNVVPLYTNDLLAYSSWSFSGAIKVIYTGETPKCLWLDDERVSFEALLFQRPVAIVYESADLHSAAIAVLEILSFNNSPNTTRSGCSVYVQASIKEKFYSLLEAKLSKMKISYSDPKADMICNISDSQSLLLSEYVNNAGRQGFKVVSALNLKNAVFSPKLIFDVPTTSELLRERIQGPLIITTPFHTVKESIAMFNHNKLGSEVSVWTEKLPLALEVSRKLRTRTVWVNTQNVFDAAVSYGGLGLGGNSIEGGTEGYFTRFNSRAKTSDKTDLYGQETPTGTTLKDDPNIKHNYELHTGGSYKKPSGGTYTVLNSLKDNSPFAYVAVCSSADIEGAVSTAVAVQQKWDDFGKYKRLQVLRKAAHALLSKEKELLPILNDLTGSDSKKEFQECVELLNLWSNDTNYKSGQLVETETCGKVLQERYPSGVIGIQVFDKEPLLSFVSTVIPAIAYGNAVVALVKSEHCSIPAFKMCEILHSSGVHGGIVNVITGPQEYLTRHLALNASVDSVWYSQEDATSFLHKTCFTNTKRVHFCKYSNEAKLKENLQEALVSEATYLKSIFMPMGDIFAN
ncbi:hypothetical protein JTE90_024585 [Oedothorax gibbosus]|uniref:Aldehyde dehydrogenase domain-containing protein n=1 Tax=Oedothorax gibbosus TaxID=931172 RepID=A0AAV6VCK8_9ARAC|nr:hypothetical protein JTE90_024585 [Oedothorax gibbosus]